MIRKLKALSLVLGVVFAMGAMMASTASATDVFTNSKGSGTDLLTGVSSDGVLSLGSVKFECKTARFAATATHSDTSVTGDAEYVGTPKVVNHTATEHCLGNASDKIVVDMNECDYDAAGGTTQKDKADSSGGTIPDAAVWITCPTGKEIKITDTTLGVTVKIHEQTPTEGGGTFTNLPTHSGGEAIEVTATVTGTTYTCEPAFTCGLAGISTEGDNSTFTGHAKVTCYEDKNAKGVITPASEGPQTGCKMS
jgi:hypothetical protein